MFSSHNQNLHQKQKKNSNKSNNYLDLCYHCCLLFPANNFVMTYLNCHVDKHFVCVKVSTHMAAVDASGPSSVSGSSKDDPMVVKIESILLREYGLSSSDMPRCFLAMSLITRSLTSGGISLLVKSGLDSRSMEFIKPILGSSWWVCFATVDLVSWFIIASTSTLPSVSGSPADSWASLTSLSKLSSDSVNLP